MYKLRNYVQSDSIDVSSLFIDTIRTVNSKDYNHQQIEAWIKVDADKLNRDLLSSHSKVITKNDAVLGFANIDDTGYIDMFYIHAKHQGNGLGSLLLKALESETNSAIIFVHASITARPFFEQRGYQVKHRNVVYVRGQEFINYAMFKQH